jgi:hypothetical protein
LSDLTPGGGPVWRIVEAQHRYSTGKLVDNPDQQRRLEELLDPTKPPVPAECRHLHYLLFTPFRYAARTGSRFRRAGPSNPVFYAAERERTALAEVTFWRLMFYAESPETPWPLNPAEMTAFSVTFETAALLDLTQEPYSITPERWSDPVDYENTQTLAEKAFEAGAEAIRSVSVRDPDKGMNITIMRCAAFRDTSPLETRTWRLTLSQAGPFAIREALYDAVTYGRGAFANDPRIRTLRWER